MWKERASKESMRAEVEGEIEALMCVDREIKREKGGGNRCRKSGQLLFLPYNRFALNNSAIEIL